MNSVIEYLMSAIINTTFYILTVVNYVRQLFNNYTPTGINVTPQYGDFVKIISSNVVGMVISVRPEVINGEPYWVVRLDPVDIRTLYPYSGTTRIIAQKLLIVDPIINDFDH